MSRIVLELTPRQADEMIRDLGRAIVLLDVAMKRTVEPKQRGVYIAQTLRLQDWCDVLDDARREPSHSLVVSEARGR